MKSKDKKKSDSYEPNFDLLLHIFLLIFFPVDNFLLTFNDAHQ